MVCRASHSTQLYCSCLTWLLTGCAHPCAKCLILRSQRLKYTGDTKNTVFVTACNTMEKKRKGEGKAGIHEMEPGQYRRILFSCNIPFCLSEFRWAVLILSFFSPSLFFRLLAIYLPVVWNQLVCVWHCRTSNMTFQRIFTASADTPPLLLHNPPLPLLDELFFHFVLF